MNRLERVRARLARDRKEGWIAGVCAGVARYLNIDPSIIRVALVVGAIFAWKVVLAAYIVAWILLPKRDE